MTKEIFKLFGIFFIIILIIVFTGGISSKYDNSCSGVNVWGCLPSSFGTMVLALFLVFVFGIPIIIFFLTKKYSSKSVALSIDGKPKKSSTIGIEIIYWFIGVIIPGRIAISNFIIYFYHLTNNPYADPDTAYYFSILFAFIVIVCSGYFWLRIRPSKYRSIIFGLIAIGVFTSLIIGKIPM